MSWLFFLLSLALAHAASDDLCANQVAKSSTFDAAIVRDQLKVIQQLVDLKKTGIETDRLVLKKLEAKDRVNLRALLEEGKGTLYPSTEHVDQRIDQHVQRAESDVPTVDRGASMAFAIYDKATKEVVGHLDLSFNEGARAFSVAYIVKKSDRNQGYATEALGAAINTFHELSQRKFPLNANLLNSNEASRRVLIKNGFKFVGEIPSFGEGDDGISFYTLEP